MRRDELPNDLGLEPQVPVGAEEVAAIAADVADKIDDAPSDGKSYVRRDGIWIEASSGGSSYVGTAVLDFGAFPGSHEASVSVTGQTGILAGSAAAARVVAVATSDHTISDHAYAALFLALTTGAPTAGVGFTIYARSAEKLQGTFTIQWAWS